jgi:hypothetical protein
MNRIFRIPYNNSIGEIQKILKQVYTLYSTGYVHGDIKIENLMMKDDGTLTLIDYDFFGTRDEFYKFISTKGPTNTSIEYFGFTNQPPESFMYFLLNNINTYRELFIKNDINTKEKYKLILNQVINDLTSNKNIKHRIDEYIQYNSNLFSFVGIGLTYKSFYNSLVGNLEDFIKIFDKYGQGRSIPDFFKVFLLEKFDSYNTGVSLLLAYYVYYFYTFNKSKDSILMNIDIKLAKEKFNSNTRPEIANIYYDLLQNIKNNILKKMIDPFYINRMNIRTAVMTMNELLQESSKKMTNSIKPKNNNKTAKRSRPTNNTNNTSIGQEAKKNRANNE